MTISSHRSRNVAGAIEDALLRHDRGGAPDRCLVRLSGDPDAAATPVGAVGIRRVITASRDSVRVEVCGQRQFAESDLSRGDLEALVGPVERSMGGWTVTTLVQIDVPWVLDAAGAENHPATAQAIVDIAAQLGSAWASTWANAEGLSATLGDSKAGSVKNPGAHSSAAAIP